MAKKNPRLKSWGFFIFDFNFLLTFPINVPQNTKTR